MLRSALLLLFSSIILHSYSQDTIPDSDPKDSIVERYYNPEFKPRQISLRSLAIPGWGQWTNHQYWKVPIAAGSVATGIAGIIHYSRQSSRYSNAVSLRLDTDSLTIDEFDGILSTPDLLVKNGKQKNLLNSSVMFTLWAHTLNVLDAYTTAVVRRKPSPHHPLRAVFYSSFFPGTGQLYNQRYWKAPLVWAAMGTAVWFIVDNTRTYQDLGFAYSTRNDGDAATVYETEFTSLFAKENLLAIREDFRFYRDISYISAAAIYLLNIVDAAVDAHLYFFDVDDDLSFYLSPVLSPRDPGISLRISF